MSRLTFTETGIAGLTIVERSRIGDARGFLCRLFCSEELQAAGWRKPIAQINHTMTRRRGTVRGMHYQTPPHSEMKLVSCLRGEVWDVAVDIRRGSPTFLQWRAERLSSENLRALVIPEGMAHGFQALTDDVELLYCHSAHYTPGADLGLNPRDPALSIAWPAGIEEISARDAAHPYLTDRFEGIEP
jgi:dTDP-4-dehydrorhamnose 3,5-epimerase